MGFFAGGYMRLLYRFLQLDSEREAAFFGDTGFTGEDLLAAEPRLSFTEQMQLCRNALAISEPGFGLRIGAQLQLAAHGALGTAMQNSNDLQHALETFTELGGARASFFRLDIHAQEEDAVITLTIDGLDEDLVPFFSESILSTLCHAIAFYAGSTDVITGLEVGYPAPRYQQSYGDAFGVTPEFAAEATRIHLPAACLRMTTHDPDPQVYADAVARCRQEIEQLGSRTDTVAAVEQFLWSNPGKLWGVDELADALNTSTRTLLRRLKSQDTSYQELRDGVLRQQAELYLGSMSVADTAAALGFADESSFRRSFKRWTGVAPGDFRRSVVNDSAD